MLYTRQSQTDLNARIIARAIPQPRSGFDAIVNHYLQREYLPNDPDWQKITTRNEDKIRNAEQPKTSLLHRVFRAADPTKPIDHIWDRQWRDNIRLKEDFFSKYGPAAEYRWGDRHLLVRNAAGVLTRVLLLSNVIREIKPKRVLEIASGDGLNLFFLASFHPEIEFVGVELTQGGVETSKEFQRSNSRLPVYMSSLFPNLVKDENAFLSIRFEQGDARKLPISSGSYDMIITCVGLEQMESIRAKALREVARICKGWTALLEPFKNFNSAGITRTYIVKYNYFQGEIGQMESFGLRPVFICDDIPQKLNLNAGLVVCKKADTY